MSMKHPSQERLLLHVGGSPGKAPPADLPASVVLSGITESLRELDTGLQNLPHRELRLPSEEIDVSPAIPDLPDPEYLIEKLKQTEARLEHETINRIHAEQVLQAHISDQVTVPAAVQGTPADIPQDVITDNPLEKVKM